MQNNLKQRLLNGECTIGIFLLSGNSMVAEACATLPIDWLLIDMEAGFTDKQEVLHVLQALKGTGASPLIRVWDNDKHAIEFALDSGSTGVMVPKVDTKEDAEVIAKGLCYNPEGTRGVNPVRASNYFENMGEYFLNANKNLIGIVQIESTIAVENCDEIASVAHIDILFIGCGDLACSYGQPGNVEGETMAMARQKVLKACKQHNKVPGIFAYSNDLAVQYIQEGFRFVAIGNEIKLLKDGLTRSLEAVKKI